MGEGPGLRVHRSHTFQFAICISQFSICPAAACLPSPSMGAGPGGGCTPLLWPGLPTVTRKRTAGLPCSAPIAQPPPIVSHVHITVNNYTISCGWPARPPPPVVSGLGRTAAAPGRMDPCASASGRCNTSEGRFAIVIRFDFGCRLAGNCFGDHRFLGEALANRLTG